MMEGGGARDGLGLRCFKVSRLVVCDWRAETAGRDSSEWDFGSQGVKGTGRRTSGGVGGVQDNVESRSRGWVEMPCGCGIWTEGRVEERWVPIVMPVLGQFHVDGTGPLGRGKFQ